MLETDFASYGVRTVEIQPANDGGFSIAGDPEELGELGELVARVAHGAPEVERRAPGEGFPLVAMAAPGPVRVRDEDGRLVLVGDRRLLYIAAWLRALSARPGRQATLAWYPGHFYLAESSVPLTLSCRG